MLKCDFNIQKLPVKLSLFHQQVLLYWNLLYNHNFTPHNTPIWNNRYITVKRKSLYNKDWLDKGIWSLIHLVESDGSVMSYETFCLKYDLVVNRSYFTSIVKAIPNSVLELTKGIVLSSINITPRLPHLLVGGCDFENIKIPNKTIRKMYNDIAYPLLSFRNSIKQSFSKRDIYRLRSRYLKFPINPKAKEIHFKILNGVYPSSQLLRQRFGFETDNCIFCDENESSEHLFYQCMFTEALWTDIHDWLHTEIRLEPFSQKDIIYGLVMDNNECDFLVNNIVILGKFYIHKCKFMKVKPRFISFHNEFLAFTKALKIMKSKNAMKLFRLIEKYNLQSKP